MLPKTNEETEKKAKMAYYKNNLYKLFLTEFVAILKKNRNIKIRNNIIDLIKSTNFEDSKSTSLLRYKLTELLENNIEDLKKIRTIISQSYLFSNKKYIDISIEMINSSDFLFDLQLLNSLKQLDSHEEIVNSLKVLMKNVIDVNTTYSLNDEINNIYVACSSSLDNNICKNNKLVIPYNKIDEFYDILASDIMNPYNTSLNILCISGIFDELEFIKRPDENIVIEIL